MKKVIFLCVVVAIVAILAGVHPTKVDANTIYGVLCICIFVTPVVMISYDIITDYIRNKKEEKIRREKEAEIEGLTRKYSHLADNLSVWMGDACILVKWCKYSSKFMVSYEHTWKRLCVRTFIDCDGIADEIIFAINGYKKDFLCKEHEEKFWDIVYVLIKRIDDMNDGK